MGEQLPGNRLRGLPNITGLIVLNDPETGLPWQSWTRPGSRPKGRAQPRPSRPNPGQAGSRTAGVLGCGFKEGATSRRFGRSFRWRESLPMIRIRWRAKISGGDAEGRRDRGHCREDTLRSCEGFDVVVTAGPITKVPMPRSSRVGSARGLRVACRLHSYWTPGLAERISSARTIFGSSNTRKAWAISRESPGLCELGDLVSGRKAGRESDLERTIACNLGLALDDMATAPLVYKSPGFGDRTWLPL